MEQLLFNLLQGPLSSMGVSDADLANYIGQCIGYVYAIIAVIVIVIAAIVVASLKAKKGFKLPINVTAIVAGVLALVLIANMVCFGPMRTVLNQQLAGGIELSEETVAASKEIISEVGDEGLVLLKNNGLLPLADDVTALNVFGWGSTNPIFGGTGSGSSDGSSAVGILGSLQDAGYATNEELSKIYTDYRTDRPVIAMGGQDWTLPEPTVDVYTDSVMSQATGFSDTAVIVISRSGGEGADLPKDMNAVIHGTYDVKSTMMGADGIGTNENYGYTAATYENNGSYDDFEEGEHYLELSVTEENMVEKVCSEFDNVIVVINANNTMELGWTEEYPQIGAVIYAPGTGNTGMSALGKIIKGEVNPSGRTVDTFVRDLTATPTWNNFGNFSYNNVDDLRQQIAKADPAYEGNIAFANYVEGIYNGYKFYETAAEEGLIDYDQTVMYPFGYGLSYTEFTQEITNFDASGDNVTFDVVVTNTGSVAGKDVVEVYFNPPYNNGGIEKASVNLVQFGKTGLLEAGANETISFSIPKEDFASYDDGIKISGGGYILEAGDYTVSIRANSHEEIASETFTVDTDIDYSSGRASDLVPVSNQFQDYSRGDFVQLSRKDGFANYEEATAAPSDDAYVMSDDVRAAISDDAVGIYDGTLYDDANDAMPTQGADNGRTLYDMRGKAIDDPEWEGLLDQLTFEDMAIMINMGGWMTAEVTSVGKVGTSDCDGPAGLSNFVTGAYGTAYPTEILMAQTWNTELINRMGEAMGQEYADADNFGWYGPAMNGHRSAFAGRNFEYYSEDGVLAGYIAAAECNGAAKKGVYPYIKHFAVNDQETNRCSFLLTWASEQAIREIYLKPFELCVKGAEYEAMAAMSSFNWIGTEPSCANPHLLNTVLRDEWGFVGLVETDYNGSYGYQITDHCIRNGNDLMLGFGANASGANALTDQSATALLAMRGACKNIMYTVVNSGYYADGDSVGGSDAVTSTLVPVDIAVVVIMLLIEAAVLFLAFKKRKAAN